jgi:hypothetical protein
MRKMCCADRGKNAKSYASSLSRHPYRARVEERHLHEVFPAESMGFLQFPVEKHILPCSAKKALEKGFPPSHFTGFFTM